MPDSGLWRSARLRRADERRPCGEVRFTPRALVSLLTARFTLARYIIRPPTPVKTAEAAAEPTPLDLEAVRREEEAKKAKEEEDRQRRLREAEERRREAQRLEEERKEQTRIARQKREEEAKERARIEARRAERLQREKAEAELLRKQEQEAAKRKTSRTKPAAVKAGKAVAAPTDAAVRKQQVQPKASKAVKPAKASLEFVPAKRKKTSDTQTAPAQPSESVRARETNLPEPLQMLRAPSTQPEKASASMAGAAVGTSDSHLRQHQSSESPAHAPQVRSVWREKNTRTSNSTSTASASVWRGPATASGSLTASAAPFRVDDTRDARTDLLQSTTTAASGGSQGYRPHPDMSGDAGRRRSNRQGGEWMWKPRTSTPPLPQGGVGSRPPPTAAAGMFPPPSAHSYPLLGAAANYGMVMTGFGLPAGAPNFVQLPPGAVPTPFLLRTPYGDMLQTTSGTVPPVHCCSD